jgi:GNAT superfamily N-acetyltransferase
MARLYAGLPVAAFPSEVTAPAGIARLLQTGHAFLVATYESSIAGAVRHGQHEGIAWLDLLASSRPYAGAALLQGVEARAQDQGLRLVHVTIGESDRVEAFFSRHGYVPFSRERDRDGQAVLRLERRLPLLTVREQRRSDAAAIGRITGEDTWMLEQHVLPGWFVASDGERVVGAINVSDGGAGVGRIAVPALLDSYRGRGLEVWMVERAALHAETGGYHTLVLAGDPRLEPLKRDLEDRRWFRESDGYVKRLAPPPHTRGHDD